MDDPRGPLSISLLLGFIFIILAPIDPIFMGIGSFLAFISITMIIFNSLPNIRKRRKILQKGAKIVGFGQLYAMVVKHYIPKFCKWYILMLIAMMAILPAYVAIAPLFFDSEPTIPVDAETGAWDYPSDFPGYKDSDNDGINDYNPDVPLDGIYKHLWRFRGSVPRYKYLCIGTYIKETKWCGGIWTISGFTLPVNGMFNLIEFFTAGMFYFGAVIRDPGGYAPILPILLPYLLVSGLFSTVPLVALILSMMFIFVIVVYGAAPVIAGQVVKLPFRLIDWFTFLIRITLISITVGGIAAGLLGVLLKIPLAFTSMGIIILKMGLVILTMMKSILGFWFFLAAFMIGASWFISKQGIRVVAFGIRKYIIITGYAFKRIVDGVIEIVLLLIDTLIGGPIRLLGGGLFKQGSAPMARHWKKKSSTAKPSKIKARKRRRS